MRKTVPVLLGACIASAMLAPTSFAQTSSFLVRSQQGSIVQTLSDGATLTFNSEGIAQAVNAVVTVTYRGTATAVIGAFELTGATDFAITTSPALPVTLNPGETLSFLITFSPTTTGRFPARLVVPFAEGVRTTGSHTINLVGVLPEYGFSYIPLPRGNQNSIGSGGTITFPDTAVNQTSGATLIVSNRGTGPGTVNAVTPSGAAQFTLGGVPLLPAVIPAGQEVRITITFAPTQAGSGAGSVRIDFAVGTATINFTGTGTAAAYSYEFVTGSTSRSIVTNDTLAVAQTNVGEKSFATVRVRNTGNADGVISAIAASGAAEFTLTDVPFLPQTLTPGASLQFNIQFLPKEPGTINARVRVGDAFFNVTGVGLGSTLTYAFSIGSASTTIANNGNVILPPTAVGAVSQARFQISNTGNTATFVNSISIPGTTVFTLAEVPALPARVGGGESVSFTVLFAPAAIGSATATLKVDALNFTVTATGSDPPALPRVTFPGATANADPAQLVSVGITLGSPYPVNLTGKLLLNFASDFFADDPGIQFASGGRLLNFVVPANSTRALFGINQTEVRLQTGTVAGVITLAATFATEGNINLTPLTAPGTTITIRPSGPRLRSVQLGTRTASGFSVFVTGYANTRNVSQMAFTFTQATDPEKKDLKLETSSLNLSVDGPFTAYFGSTAATAFGGQFTATVNFNVRGDIDAIQSVAVTVTNAQGTSNSGSVNLR